MCKSNEFNRFVLKNCFLFSSVCVGLLCYNVKDANAGSGSTLEGPFRISYEFTSVNGPNTVTDIEFANVGDIGEYGTDNFMSFDLSGIEEDLIIPDSVLAEFKKSDDFHKSYYTDIEYNEETKILKFTDKLINESALEAALVDAGVSDMSVYAKVDDLDNLQTVVSGKADASDVSALEGVVSGLGTSVSELEADVNGLETTVAGLSSSVSGKANQSDLDNLQTVVSSKVDASEVYTKNEVDNKYATQNAISDMLTKTEASSVYMSQVGFDEYKINNENAVSDLTDRLLASEISIADISNSDVFVSGITADKVAIYDEYASKIEAKQDTLSDSQMAVLNSGITASDITKIQTASARLDDIGNIVDGLNEDFGNIEDFANSTSLNLGNGSVDNAKTVTKAIANIDATIGQVHGLAEKVSVEQGGGNLGARGNIEEHLTSLAGAIGDRSNYTEQNYIKNNQTVAKSLDSLDVAVGNMKNEFVSAQMANEVRFNGIERKIYKLEDKMGKGLAANNALAALTPLDDRYKSQVSMALGGYENNQAIAVGAFHYVNEKILLNTGVAYGGNDSLSYNVGITFGF